MEGKKNPNKFKSIFQVLFSNISTVVSGVLVSFLLPKLISVEDYGWYKTFSLYATYVGFLGLGIVEGIVLKHGGDNYEKLDRPTFRSYFKMYFVINLFSSVGIILLSIFVAESDYFFIFMALGLYVISNNVSDYFLYISQITQRFKEYSLRKYILSGIKLSVLALLYCGTFLNISPNYKMCLIYLVTGEYILSLYYIVTYREIIFGKKYNISKIKPFVKELIKCGLPLLIANQCSTLILTIDRQFVNILFDTETYAVYAFAYNMLALVTVALSAVSTVLYPALKRTTYDSMMKNYSEIAGVILFVVFGCITAYFPLCMIVNSFLPDYKDSLDIFRVIFPGLAISSVITIVMHNYYKVFGVNGIFFKRSIIVLIISGITNAVSYIIFRTTIAISIASIIAMFIWYLYIEQYLVKEFRCSSTKNIIYLIIMFVLFYLITIINNVVIGFFAYVLAFLTVSLLLQKKAIKNFMKKYIIHK